MNRNRQELEEEILKYINNGLLYNTLLELRKNDQSVKLDNQDLINTLEKLTSDKAISILEEYNKVILSDEIKNIVVNDCKKALMERTRFSKWVENGIIGLSVILSIVLLIMATTPFSQKAFETIRIYSITVFVLVIIQVIFYLILKIKS